MGWRYKAGLFLIGTVVIIWVTSAEVTQVLIHCLLNSSFFRLKLSSFEVMDV